MKPQSPKQRFLENQAATHWLQEVVVHSFFTDAADAAMLMLQKTLRNMKDPLPPAEAYQRLVGAQMFLEELKGVCEVPEPQSYTPPNDNLIH